MPACDGGFRPVTVAGGAAQFEAVGYGGTDHVWLAGRSGGPASELRYLTDAGFVDRAGNCGGRTFSAWARSDGRLYFSGQQYGVRWVTPATTTCNTLAMNSTFTSYGLAGEAGASGTTVITVVGHTTNGAVGGRMVQAANDAVLSVDGFSLAAFADQLFGVRVAPGGRLFAVGARGANEAMVARSANGTWAAASGFNGRGGVLNDIGFASATEGYAAGSNSFYVFDGTNWNAQPGAPPFNVFGLHVIGPQDVMVVGAGEGIARWRAGTWTVIRPATGGGYFNRIEGTGLCDLFVAGAATPMTTRP